MPNPTPSDYHVNQILTNMSVAYLQDKGNFAAVGMFPNIPVEKKSDRYFKYSKYDLLRDDAKEREYASESAGGAVSVDNTPSYLCRVYAYHEDVDDQTRANADAPADLDREAAENVAMKLAIRRERQWAQNFFATSKGWTDFSPATKWDADGGDIIGDINDQIIVIAKATGFRPNKMAVTPDLFMHMKENSAILDKIKYTQKGIVTPDLLAGVWDLEELFVLWGVYNSGSESASDPSDDSDMTWIAGTTESALLVYAPSEAGIRRPSAGYTFSWQGYLGATDEGIRISNFPMQHLRAERIEGEIAFDQKMVCPDLGVFIYNTLT